MHNVVASAYATSEAPDNSEGNSVVAELQEDNLNSWSSI